MEKYLRTLWLLTTLLTLALVFCAGCDAPRTNPLDPRNDDNVLRGIDGTIYTESIPNTPIDGVEVYWQGGGELLMTGSDGHFHIEDIAPEDGWLIYRKAGYHTDSTYLEWSDEKLLRFTGYMNSFPRLQKYDIFSTVKKKYSVPDEQAMHVYCAIEDEENDIDSVFFVNTELGVRDSFLYNPTSQGYELYYQPQLIPGGLLEELIGQQFAIFVRDRSGRYYSIGVSSLKRIIHQEILTIGPSNSEEVTLPVDLRWYRFTPGFTFHYRIEVYREGIPPDLVYESGAIKGSDIAFGFDSDLSAGDYFWVIWCVDEFHNQSRSKPATFTITD